MTKNANNSLTFPTIYRTLRKSRAGKSKTDTDATRYCIKEKLLMQHLAYREKPELTLAVVWYCLLKAELKF